jgi:hypothetical protein
MLRFSAFALSALLFASSALAQGFDVFGPQNVETRISPPAFYDQYAPRISRYGNRYAVAWEFGQDVWACYYDQDFAPIGAPFLVNSTLSFGVQDEPDLAFDAHGRLLIAWSDRESNDGELMGIFARAYAADGQPLGPEFQVNVQGAASQWRPLVAANRTEGWIVAWSGDWDGNAYFRIFDGSAAPRTGDVLVNEYPWDAQVDPEVAVAPDGRMFVVFIDYSSHTGGSGTNLWGRVYDALANPLTPEFLLTSTTSNGDQRNPHVVCDALGRFTIAWDDELSDGNGWGVFARRFDENGVPLGPEFQVNSANAGDQRGCTLACDASGRFVVAWNDDTQGDVEARRFSAAGLPLGQDFRVDDAVDGIQRLPDLVIDPSGSEVVAVFQGPEAGAGSTIALFARRFLRSDGPHVYCSAKLNSQGCYASMSWQGTPSASSSSPFVVRANGVVNQKFGLLLWSASSAFLPFQGGTLCLGQSFRTPAMSSEGSPSGNDCTGSLAFDFNTLVHAGTNPLLVPGAQLQAQYYYRDLPNGGTTTGLSDALRFTIQP